VLHVSKCPWTCATNGLLPCGKGRPATRP